MMDVPHIRRIENHQMLQVDMILLFWLSIQLHSLKHFGNFFGDLKYLPCSGAYETYELMSFSVTSSKKTLSYKSNHLLRMETKYY